VTVTAAIKFTQGMTTAPAGQALIGVPAVAVVCSNGVDFNAISWEWELIGKPTASALTLGIFAFGATPTGSFTPDVRGWYAVRLSVFDSLGRRAVDTRIFAIPEVSGRHIPCVGADRLSANFAGSDKGWDPYLEAWLKYVDTLGGGAAAEHATYKAVRVVTDAAITLSGTQTVNGVALVAGDRCGVLFQASLPTNGIYIVSAGAWTRAPDMATASTIPYGAFFYSELGDNAFQGLFVENSTAGIDLVVGTDDINFGRLYSQDYINATHIRGRLVEDVAVSINQALVNQYVSPDFFYRPMFVRTFMESVAESTTGSTETVDFTDFAETNGGAAASKFTALLRIEVIARNVTVTKSAHWIFEGVRVRQVAAGTLLLESAGTVDSEDGGTGWTVALSVSAGNLRLTCVGAVADASAFFTCHAFTNVSVEP
jgi:hypothetical protein